jgi:thiamine biosynthesis lipoprotein
MDGGTDTMKTPHLFEHEAMNTVFSLRIIESSESHAREVALAAFALLDSIEQKLSRYIEGSDVWQINHLESGQKLFLSDATHECLLLSLKASEMTGGLFDVSLGHRIDHYKSEETGPPPPETGKLHILPDRPAIHCETAGRALDLGGIGKGYALDQMQDLLKDWNIENALLCAGSSTQLAFGSQAWPISLETNPQKQVHQLKNQALSASGTATQGAHIVSPYESESTFPHPRIWVIHSSAALADAFSTAALLMQPDELKALEAHAQVLTPVG